MIHVTLAQVVSELNAYVHLRAPGAPADRVVAAGLFRYDGTPNPAARDRIAAQVVNVEENSVYRSIETTRARADGTYEQVKPSVRVNAYVLFVANLDNYIEALKALALVVAFFQNRYTFDVPNNGDGSSHVVFDLYSMTFEELNHMWASLGAKYVPSVVYKAAILDISDQQVQAEVPPVEEIMTEA